MVQSRVKTFLIFAFSIVFAVFFSFLICWFVADLNYARGTALLVDGYYLRAEESLFRSVLLWPREPAYLRTLARLYAHLASSSRAADLAVTDGHSLLAAAQTYAEKAYQVNPRNFITTKSLIYTYYLLSKQNEAFQLRTEQLISRGESLCPTDPSVPYLAAVIYRDWEMSEKSATFAERALHLKPDFTQAAELQVSD
ncbi:MAG: tetratricopeptide repeat protein [Patescibacteria group bacterium]